MGCNTSQEPAAVPVESDDNAANNATDDAAGTVTSHAEPETKKEIEQQNHQPEPDEPPMVNGDPLGKDEGE